MGEGGGLILRSVLLPGKVWQIWNSQEFLLYLEKSRNSHEILSEI